MGLSLYGVEWQKVYKELGVISREYRSKRIRELMKERKIKFSGRDGVDIYYTPAHLPVDYLPPRNKLEKIFDFMEKHGMALPGWLSKLILYTYEIGDKRAVYPYIFVDLNTPPCIHWLSGGCLMCGYQNKFGKRERGGTIWKKFLEKGYSKIFASGYFPFASIYTSGSFFDDREIDQRTRIDIVKKFYEWEVIPMVATRPDIFIDNIAHAEDISSVIPEPDFLSIGFGVNI